MISFRSPRFGLAAFGLAVGALVGCASGTDDFIDTTTTTTTSAGGGGSGAMGGQGGSGATGAGATGAGGTGATGGQGGSGATGAGGTGAIGGQGGSGATGAGGAGATGGQGGSGGSGPVGGDTCASALDVSAETFPFVVAGQFDGDPAVGGSCDATPTNAVWFSYTAPTTGSYRIDLVNNTGTFAYSVVAVFDGTDCNPLASELLCDTLDDSSISTAVDLVQGQSYLVLFHTDGDSFTMVNPTISVTEMVPGSGDTCPLAYDVTSETFPYQHVGQFDFDPPAGGSCDTTPTNGVWFSYTPPADGLYQIDLVNHTATNAYSVVAVFEGTACNPLGTEVACTTQTDVFVSDTPYLTGGQDYLILFHTDGDSYTMVDPEITITPIVIGPGDTCPLAYDVTAEAFPYQATGIFGVDPAVGGSCDTTPTNAVWFSYTAPTTGDYRFDLVNQSPTSASSRLAIFDGTACSPLGTQLSCTTTASKNISATVALTQGQSYLVLFHTDADANALIDPTIAVTEVVPTPGDSCALAYDVTAETFPYLHTGQFDGDPAVGGSCDTTPNNAVWFSYTAPADGDYRFDLVNQTATAAFSRLAIFDGTACSPLGTQLSCTTASSKSVSATVTLTLGQSYLVLFHTDGDSYTMIDPQITVTQLPPAAPGESCVQARDVSAEVFPFTLAGTFAGDPAVGGSCDTTPTNAVWFSYTAPADGDYRFDLANQTATNAYSRLAIFDGTACGPLGTQLSCTTASSKSISATVTLTQGQSYLVLFHTDGDTYTMVDPRITVTQLPPASPGETCSAAYDASAETFPFTLTGTFGADPAVGGSCDTTPTNAVWFSYAPATSGLYRIDLTNQTATAAYSVAAVFEGTACSPLGPQLSCIAPSSKSASTTVYLEQGKSYLILFHTDGDSYTMVDPTLAVASVPVVPGEICQTTYDVSAQSYPFQLVGTFGNDPLVGGTCDTTPTNVVWFSFTPSATASYTIDLVNHTGTIAWSRVAVFTGLGCTPYGTQVACTTANSPSVSTTVALTAGQPYLIAFYTDGDSYTMVDPEITITP